MMWWELILAVIEHESRPSVVIGVQTIVNIASPLRISEAVGVAIVIIHNVVEIVALTEPNSCTEWCWWLWCGL